MRKSLFMMVVLSLCVADFSAFAAPARRVNAARAAATTNKVVNPVVQQNPNVQPNNVGGSRIRQTNTGGSGVVGTSGVVNNNKGAGAGVGASTAARAAATKKAINMGTKVAAATENTVVSQECQNAYYGCMDAFCMLDNASGGRCQCNDKITELDEILDQIMKLDEQSMRIATEGVETVEMGEYANEIKSRTKSIEGEITADGKKAEATTAKKKTLDLSAWNNSSLFDDDDFDFDSGADGGTKIANDLSDKKGDELHRQAAKLCTTQLPAQCKESASMLQMTYAQRIRSDCTGYENSLKQKKTESAQKLQTAQKAVREAVLEDVKNKNKYTTEGECVVAFDQCMQTTAKCGSDYTGCIADDTVLTMGTDGTAGKATSAQIKTSASAIGVSANTLAMLTDRAPVCETVLKQCVNVRKGVWAAYLKMIAPTLKSAEVIAEQDRRMNCISNIVDCYKKGCAARWPDEESDDYDMCLSNPSILGNICAVQINKCSTAGTGEQVMEYVKAKLASLRVDQCTKEVKDCLTSEERCGKDFTKCVGLDTYSIARMCPTDKLVACAKDGSYKDSEAILEYVNNIAKGLALNIDNNLLTKCQEAVDKAFADVCGGEEDCTKVIFDLSSLKSLIKVQACNHKSDNTKDCQDGLLGFDDNDIYAFDYVITWEDEDTKKKIKTVKSEHRTGAGYGVYAELVGKPDISSITYDGGKRTAVDENNQPKKDTQGNEIKEHIGFKLAGGSIAGDFDNNNTKKVIDILNDTLNGAINSIENDPTVKYCMSGREVEGMNGEKFGLHSNTKAPRFPNITDNKRTIIASSLLSALVSKNLDLEKSFEEKLAAMTSEIAKRMGEIAEAKGAEVESLIDAYNAERCTCDANSSDNSDKGCYASKDVHTQPGSTADYRLATAYIRQLTDVDGEYDTATNVCKLSKKQYTCTKYLSPSCRTFDKGEVLSTSTVQMQKFK